MRAIAFGFLLLFVLVEPAFASSAGERALGWAEAQRDAALGAVANAERRLSAAESDLAVSRGVERDISASKDAAALAVAKQAVSVSEQGVGDARNLLRRARALLAHWQDTIASINKFNKSHHDHDALVVPVEGQVRYVTGAGAFTSADILSPPRPGERIEVGPGGSARVFASVGDAEIALAQNSSLTITRDIAGDSFEALLGQGYARIRVMMKKYSNKFEVRTPTVAIAVRGTDFSVQSSASGSRVEVFESAVYVSPLQQGGVGVEVHAGEGCDILNAGGIQPAKPLPPRPRNDFWSDHGR